MAGACVRVEDCAFWTVFLHLLFSRGSCVVGGDQSVWRSESFEAAREGVRAAELGEAPSRQNGVKVQERVVSQRERGGREFRVPVDL